MKERNSQFFSVKNVVSFVALNLATLANARENPDPVPMAPTTPADNSNDTTLMYGLIPAGIAFAICLCCGCIYRSSADSLTTYPSDESSDDESNNELVRLESVTATNYGT